MKQLVIITADDLRQDDFVIDLHQRTLVKIQDIRMHKETGLFAPDPYVEIKFADSNEYEEFQLYDEFMIVMDLDKLEIIK